MSGQDTGETPDAQAAAGATELTDASGPKAAAATGAEAGTAGDTRHLAYEEARLAYTIIQALLNHTQVTQDLVALMAQVLDRETQDALVNTPNWAAYMDSRRVLEGTRRDVEKFAEVWTRLAEEFGPES